MQSLQVSLRLASSRLARTRLALRRPARTRALRLASQPPGWRLGLRSEPLLGLLPQAWLPPGPLLEPLPAWSPPGLPLALPRAWLPLAPPLEPPLAWPLPLALPSRRPQASSRLALPPGQPRASPQSPGPLPA